MSAAVSLNDLLADMIEAEVKRQLAIALSKMAPAKPAPLMTAPEVAELLNCSPPTVARLAERGVLRVAIDVGNGSKAAPRFDRDEIAALLAERKRYADEGCDTSPLDDNEFNQLVRARDGSRAKP